MGIYFRGIGEQRPKFEVKRGTKTILGNREHKKNKFSIFGEHGNKPIYLRGTREQVGGPRIYNQSLCCEEIYGFVFLFKKYIK